MKKILLTIVATSLMYPVQADVIKESQAKREVDDSSQALNTMDSRKELASYLPQKEAFNARTYSAKAQRYLKEGEYDKASFYAVLASNYAKISVAKGLLAKAEKDNLEAKLAANQIATVTPRLKSAGLKQKGTTPFFSGSYDLKALYAVKKAPALDAIPDLAAEMASRVTEISAVLTEQPEIKIQINVKGKSVEHAEKYAESIKNAMVEQKIAAEDRKSVV